MRQEFVVIHRRILERHPELAPDDVAYAWANRITDATRYGRFGDETVAVGFDLRGRLVEMVGVAAADGSVLVYHAMTPPSKKTLHEVGLG